MDIFLKSLKQSIKHLEIIDNVFSNSEYDDKEIYLKIKENLLEFNSKIPFNKFNEELYVGGKKRNSSRNQGYGRQMILSDIIEYIINGRGYFYAIRNKEAMKSYLRIIIEIVNQLMIMDSIVINLDIRKKILEELKEGIGEVDFFKEEDRKKEHEALLLHKQPIGFPLKNTIISNEVLEKLELTEAEKSKAINKLETYYDSLLPKTAGGLWGELLTYAYLLRLNVGFIFPLLLNQRLLTGENNIFLKPPDLLLLPYGKQTFYGIEIGAGKDVQSGNFSIITGLPTATKANMDNPKRCCVCGKWMLFCPKVVEEYTNTDNEVAEMHKPIKCLTDCNKFSKEEILEGKCSFAMHKGGNPKKYLMQMKGSTYHFHLKCLLNDDDGKNQISENKIVSYYPYISGLEEFEKMDIDKELIDKKIEELKKYIAETNQEKD